MIVRFLIGERTEFLTEDEEQLQLLCNGVNAFVIQGELGSCVEIQRQLREWVETLGHYDYLTDGEWTAYVTATDAVWKLVTECINKIVKEDADSAQLRELFPVWKSYQKDDFAKLLEGDSEEEDRLYRDFYPPNLDDDSDDSDEDDEQYAQRNTRTAQVRKKRTMKRRKTRRVLKGLNPAVDLLRKRMEAIAKGSGRSIARVGVDVPLEEDVALVLPEDVSTAPKALADRNKAKAGFEAWMVETYREKRKAQTWNGPVPDSMIVLKDQLTVIDKKAVDEKTKPLSQANSKVAGYTTALKKLFADVRGKLSWGHTGMVQANAAIRYPKGTLTEEVKEELKGVNEDIAAGKVVRKNRFAIAQYRGITYDVDSSGPWPAAPAVRASRFSFPSTPARSSRSSAFVRPTITRVRTSAMPVSRSSSISKRTACARSSSRSGPAGRSRFRPACGRSFETGSPETKAARRIRRKLIRTNPS